MSPNNSNIITKKIPAYFYDPITSQQIKVSRQFVMHVQVFIDDVFFNRVSISIQRVDEKDVDRIITQYQSQYQASNAHAFKECRRKYEELNSELQEYFLASRVNYYKKENNNK